MQPRNARYQKRHHLIMDAGIPYFQKPGLITIQNGTLTCRQFKINEKLGSFQPTQTMRAEMRVLQADMHGYIFVL